MTNLKNLDYIFQDVPQAAQAQDVNKLFSVTQHTIY